MYSISEMKKHSGDLRARVFLEDNLRPVERLVFYITEKEGYIDRGNNRDIVNRADGACR